jgi:penicillin-binding protein 2
MHLATTGMGGTAWRAQVPGIDVCGKTGTSQNPHGKNHSVFVCFAPRQNPKIAVAVLVENSGAGGSYATPIASLVMEKYLKGKILRTDLEQWILSMNLLSNNSDT